MAHPFSTWSVVWMNAGHFCFMKLTDKIEITNEDNMVMMARYPDKHFDLAICDPPYGILANSGNRLDKYGLQHKEWDKEIPKLEYWNELFRVSKNQIVFGANNFWNQFLPNTTNFFFWYKHQPIKNWAAGELAWTSFKGVAKCCDYMCYGNVGGDDNRFHPTQKPTYLYKWILDTYGNGGG